MNHGKKAKTLGRASVLLLYILFKEVRENAK